MDAVTFNSLESKKAEEAFEISRTVGVAPNVPDVASLNSLEFIERRRSISRQ